MNLRDLLARLGLGPKTQPEGPLGPILTQLQAMETRMSETLDTVLEEVTANRAAAEALNSRLDGVNQRLGAFGEELRQLRAELKSNGDAQGKIDAILVGLRATRKELDAIGGDVDTASAELDADAPVVETPAEPAPDAPSADGGTDGTAPPAEG